MEHGGEEECSKQPKVKPKDWQGSEKSYNNLDSPSMTSSKARNRNIFIKYGSNL